MSPSPPSSGSNRGGSPWVSRGCTVVGRRLDMGGANDQLRGVRLRGQQGLGEQIGVQQTVRGDRAVRGSVPVASERVARDRAAAVEGRRPPMVWDKLSVERRTARPVPATLAPVARTTVARVAPLTRMIPARNRNTARISAPRVDRRWEVSQNSA